MILTLNTPKNRVTKKGRANIAACLKVLAEEISDGSLVITHGYAQIEINLTSCLEINMRRGFAYGGVLAHAAKEHENG